MPATRRRLRKDILKARGLTHIKVPPVSNPTSPVRMRKLVPVNERFDHLKTDAMKLLELTLGQPIDRLLSSSHNMAEVARTLGIDRATVLRWKRRLGIK